MITVIKNDHNGREVWRYTGREVARGPAFVQLEARFARADVETAYHTFRRGDRFIEWFFSDRWYNIFEMHAAEDDRLVGWYCNVTRPAVLEADTVRADDLALDVFVAPDGTQTTLDEDEFAALPLDEPTRARALAGLAALSQLIEDRQPPFNVLPKTQNRPRFR